MVVAIVSGSSLHDWLGSVWWVVAAANWDIITETDRLLQTEQCAEELDTMKV